MGTMECSSNLFLSIDLLRKLIVLWRFYINTAGCEAITVYWFETFFITSPKKNNAFVKLFETSLDSDMLASLTEFQCQGGDTCGFILV